MDRRLLLESVFFAAAPPRVFFSRASLARRPQDGRRRLDALLAQGRHIVVYLQVARLAHALRPGAVPTGQMREPARVVVERRLIDDDDGAAPASHYLPSLLIATYAGATTVAPPGRAARERGRPALCANVLDEFVRALLPVSYTHLTLPTTD